MPNPLELTVTHNLASDAEVRMLLDQRLIALDWGRKESANPDDYDKPQAKSQVRLFQDVRARGGAVVAAYAKALTARPADRLIGWVEPGTPIEFVNGLICLRLRDAREIDSSRSFLGNLAPRRCTAQACGNRSKGRLLALVRGKKVTPSVWSLHHRDVETLVNSYLGLALGCRVVWTGGRSFAGIDHVGLLPDGRELLAQTTVSEASIVADKVQKLEAHGRGDGRRLMFFGPSSRRSAAPADIEYVSIEAVFAFLQSDRDGRWLIERMTA